MPRIQEDPGDPRDGERSVVAVGIKKEEGKKKRKLPRRAPY